MNKDSLTLVSPSVKYKNSFHEFYLNYKSSGEDLVPFVIKFYKDNINEYIDILDGFTKGENVPKEFVPTTTFWLINNSNEVLGVVNIRHYLNEKMLLSGGHIGYGIAPKYRRKGYGTIILKLALQKAKELDIKKCLVVCDKENVASQKIIQNNNGILESEEYVDNGYICRYWIKND